MSRVPRAAAFARYRWALVSALAVTGLVLGYIGFDERAADAGVERSFLDLLYDDLSLFGFGPGTGLTVGGSLPWQLQIARFLLPVVIIYGAFAGLAALFHERFQQVRLPFLRRHTIVVGVSEMGLAFTRAMCNAGDNVVVIDSDPANRDLTAVRQLGAIAIIGDGRDPSVLAWAGVRRARHLLATADDGTNVEVVAQAQRLSEGRRGRPLQCLAHVVDAELCELLKADAVSRPGGGITVDFFNFHDQAARVVCSLAPATTRQVVVVGSGSLAGRIIIRSVFAQNDLEDPEVLDVVIVDPEASQRTSALMARYPRLKESARLHPIDAVPDVRVLRAAPITADEKLDTVFYLCGLGDEVGMTIALGLKETARSAGSHLVVCAERAQGLSSVVRSGRRDSALETITILDLAAQTCTADLVNRGIYELLAEAIHDAYARSRKLEGSLEPDDPSLQPWETLAEPLKDSNRAQAVHIGTKLRAVGCDLVPLDEIDGPAFSLSPSERELLARMEHQRWVDERSRAGWQLGSRRDVDSRTTPYLVDWGELPEEIRDRDRETIDRLPDQVSQAGFRIVRLSTADVATGATQRSHEGASRETQ